MVPACLLLLLLPQQRSQPQPGTHLCQVSPCLLKGLVQLVGGGVLDPRASPSTSTPTPSSPATRGVHRLVGAAGRLGHHHLPRHQQPPQQQQSRATVQRMCCAPPDPQSSLAGTTASNISGHLCQYQT